jgi:sugar phosphate isomerase/epimerase
MRRREFVAAGATAALFSAMPSWAADLRRFKLGVITDEVTQDFEKALLWAKGYGLGWVELRFIWNKYVTDFAPDDIERAKELLGKYDLRVSVVDTPYFKTLLPGTQSRFSEAKGDRLQSDFSQQGAESAAMLKAVSSPSLGLNWDPGNAFAAGETPFPIGYDALDEKRIWHMHLKDAAPAPPSQEAKWMPIGGGKIDFLGQFRSLIRNDYEGTMSLETHYMNAAKDKEASSRESMDGLLKIIREA